MVHASPRKCVHQFINTEIAMPESHTLFGHSLLMKSSTKSHIFMGVCLVIAVPTNLLNLKILQTSEDVKMMGY
jgi:hypothetical protein